MTRQTQPTEDQSAETGPAGSGRSVAALAAKGAAVLAAAVASVAAIAWFVPDANDYAKAAILKHNRLESLPQKLVLIGGSNLAYGVDSDLLQRQTGCQVVNMGMNGYLGVRYMLAEARPYLHPGDVVVIALEYDSYFKPVDGTPKDLVWIAKAYPKAFTYLTRSQQIEVLKALPYVAQMKVLRLMEDIPASLIDRLRGGGGGLDIDEVEQLSGFTSKGDLVSHLDVRWDSTLEDGIDLKSTPADAEILDLLQTFQRDMDRQGVKVVVSFTPVVEEYYARYGRQIDELYDQMATQRSMPVPNRPSSFVFQKTMMFDTVYHLNAEGRAIRSKTLADDMMRYFDGHLPCAATTRLAKTGSALQDQ